MIFLTFCLVIGYYKQTKVTIVTEQCDKTHFSPKMKQL